MSFERALIHIFKVEGGFVNRSDDHGGPTNFGITLKTLEAFRKTPVTVADVKNLSAHEASEVYRQEFWDANGLFLLESARIQNLLFDQIVARGPHNAITILQKVLNNYFRAGLRPDGILGQLTAAEVNHLTTGDHPAGLRLGALYIREVQKAYLHQAINDHSQMKYLEGWLNRTFILFDFIF